MLKQFQPLIDKAVTRQYAKGSTVLYQGEVPRSACVLVEGIVRVFSISAQGDEQTVMYHVAGEFFPASWIFAKAPGTLFFYETVVDSRIAMIDRQEWMDYMMADATCWQAVLDYFATNYSASMIRVNALEQPKAREKLLYTIYYLCQRYGRKDNGAVTIPLSLTHQNLASLVGLTRETTATEMNRLKRQKVLTYDNQQYVVDIDMLLDLIGEDSFRGVRIRA